MLFNSYIFLFAFLPVTYVVFWALRSTRARHVWLAITGYVFYGYWDPRFTLLMAFSTAVSFTAGLGFLRWTDARHRRICLVVPITIDLLLLGFFKYAPFAIGSVQALSAALGSPIRIPVLEIILPVGISFYTFHTITYIVDSYRGTIKPTRSVFEFAAYVSLFSQLVAGPIVRFRQIESDLEALGSQSRTRWLGRGASFFIIGLVEKVVIADALAGFVDPALKSAQHLSSTATWLAYLAYAFQLYFDFAGYSDMAIGLGFMFGLRIPQNFNSPYKATDPSDFWRRWHISLSTCLRDYLYIPLGGSRNGEWRTYRNLMITMLLGGLWHGANWTFVLWGAYHGLLLSGHRYFARRWDVAPVLLRRTTMFVLATFGWVLFRSPTLGEAADSLARMVRPTQGVGIHGAGGLIVLLCLAGSLAIAAPNAWELHQSERPFKWRYALTLAAAFGVCLALMAGTGNSPFLYFQF